MACRWDPQVRRSRVGQKLSDLTSQRVIVLILAMLIMIPGFNWNSGLYGNYNSNFVGGLSVLHDAFLANGNSAGFQQASPRRTETLYSVVIAATLLWALQPMRHLRAYRTAASWPLSFTEIF